MMRDVVREMAQTKRHKEESTVTVYRATPEQIDKMLGGKQMGRPAGSKNKTSKKESQIKVEISKEKTINDGLLVEAIKKEVRPEPELLKSIEKPEPGILNPFDKPEPIKEVSDTIELISKEEWRYQRFGDVLIAVLDKHSKRKRIPLDWIEELEGHLFDESRKTKLESL